MFVRAPKHFKSGKQHVFFWKYFFKTYVFNSVKLLPSIFFFLKPNILFNLTLSKLSTNTNNSMKISRLTYTCDIVFKYVMWLVFFFTNSFKFRYFSFIFWILTYLAKYTYSNKFYNYKLNFYECGFKILLK